MDDGKKDTCRKPSAVWRLPFFGVEIVHGLGYNGPRMGKRPAGLRPIKNQESA